jgi:hypothetical protein
MELSSITQANYLMLFGMMINKLYIAFFLSLIGLFSCSSIPFIEKNQATAKVANVAQKVLPPYEEGSIGDGVVKAVESILPQQFLQAAKELFTVFTTKEIAITDYYRTAKFASMKVKTGRTNAIMVLANDYDGVLQWVSADEIQIFTKNGKIIRTIGLNNDIFVTDPPNILEIYTKLLSERAVAYDASIISFSEPSMDGETIKYKYFLGDPFKYSLLLNGRVIEGRILYEEIYIKKLLWKRKNKYWVNPAGQIIRSRQFLNPSIDYMEMEVIKKYDG